MGKLQFYYSTMNAGKSAAALQKAHQRKIIRESVLLVSSNDRSNEPKITSRYGISSECLSYDPHTDFYQLFESTTPNVIIVDEAQFLTGQQVDQLSRLTLTSYCDVICYGLLTDFRSMLFPGSSRLIELSDDIFKLQTVALCWCGDPGQINARVVDGIVAYEGQQVLVGDVNKSSVYYTVLCRSHFNSGEINGKVM